MTTLTLGTKLDEQLIDGALVRKTEKFLLHYNFPPFSTGEERPLRGTSRREVGHGNLALRALKPVLPPVEECPYTIRLVSEILESNGSSSMATVCAGTLALMDGGVNIKAPVSGIAMGLITDQESGKYAILSDILGDEDHLGDMDFKVTGTAEGITACQMDIKIKGLSFDQLREALEQAREGRHHIRKAMLTEISEPRDDYKDHAPRIVGLEVPGDSIGAIIGPGGKIIQEIQADTNTTISIEDVDGKGMVEIAASDKAAIEAALTRIKQIAFSNCRNRRRGRRQGENHHALRRLCGGVAWHRRLVARQRIGLEACGERRRRVEGRDGQVQGGRSRPQDGQDQAQPQGPSPQA